MRIEVPTEEEEIKKRRFRHLNFFLGILWGLFLFFLVGYKVFVYGFENVEWYSWFALGIGVLSFGVLASKFGGEFWEVIYQKLKRYSLQLSF